MKLGTLKVTGEDWSHIFYGWMVFIGGGLFTICGIVLGFEVEIKIKEIK